MADKIQQQVATPQQQVDVSKIDALYSWLSYDLQKLKKEVLSEVKASNQQAIADAKNASTMVTQELRYSYLQNQTIYDGLAELITGDADACKQAIENLKKSIDDIFPQYQATAQEVKYSFVQQQAIYDSIMEKVAKLEDFDAVLAELDRKSAEVLSLVEDYKAVMESYPEKTEECVANHAREIIDTITAVPVAENVDYARIVDEVGDRVLELIGEVMQTSTVAEEPLPQPEVEEVKEEKEEVVEVQEVKVEAKIDYDKIIYGTAEKVVESLPAREKIDYARLAFDYARIEEMIAKNTAIDYEKLADMVASKMVEKMPAPAPVETVAVQDTLDAKLDDETIEKIADKVIEKMNAMEMPEEEVTYDFVIDEEGIDSIADRVAEKLADKCLVTAPQEEKVEAVEEVTEDPVEEAVAEVVEENVAEEAPVQPVAEEIAPAAEATYDEVDDQLVDAETGLVVRLKRSFTAKMKQSEDRVKGYYSAIKNALKSYKRINSNISWHGDRFNFGRDTVAKMNICGKTLCLYLALNPEDEELKQTVYHQKNVGEQKAYASTPFMVKVKSDGAAKKAVRLIGILAEKLETQAIEGYEETDYTAEFAYETTKQLLDEGFIKLTKEKQVELNF